MSDASSEVALAAQWREGHKDHVQGATDRTDIARRCLRLIRNFAQLDNVADFGCGIGCWLSAAEQLGAKSIVGFEGSWISSSKTVISKDQIRIIDLAKRNPQFSKEYTLAMTIEVAEHLPENVANGFVRMLVSASDYVLFSAATPGQGGLGHLNEQPTMYWVRRFWDLGYVPLDPIRPFIARDGKIYGWLRQNLIMFVNYDVLLHSKEALRFAHPISHFSLEHDTKRDIGGFQVW